MGSNTPTRSKSNFLHHATLLAAISLVGTLGFSCPEHPIGRVGVYQREITPNSPSASRPRDEDAPGRSLPTGQGRQQ